MLGHEIAGVVEELAEGAISDVKVGDHVMICPWVCALEMQARALFLEYDCL